MDQGLTIRIPKGAKGIEISPVILQAAKRTMGFWIIATPKIPACLI
jgi:hypothetical protein